MPRIRSIKPDFFTSDTVSALPLRARLTWIGLWTHCDDYGRCRYNVKLIKAAVWPLDDVSLRDIDSDLRDLERAGVVFRYAVDGRQYLQVTSWSEHQKVDRPSKSPLPPPTDPIEGSMHPREGSMHPREGSPRARDRKGKEGKGEEGRGRAHARETPPAPTAPAFVPPQESDNVTDNGSAPAGTVPEPRGAAAPQAPRQAAPPPARPAELPAGPAGATTPQPPPDRCPRHADDPSPPNCGACGDARRARERWDREQLAADQQRRSAEARDRAAANADAIAACHLCDTSGYRNGALCTHDPDQADRARAGAAAARAALTRPVLDTP